MPKTDYQLQLRGYVGGYDFDRSYVDYVLDQHKDKHVDVLIDSLGGSLATALSIASAFRNHGDVSVHFVGMNASAATIASLGAKHVSMDASAMYLAHKCSTEFFQWASLNADQMQNVLDELTQMKSDLEKLDANVADMYARKCKKDSKCLLDLMKVGGWLSSKEALEWGFVDEITDYEDEKAPVLTDAVASAMANAGIPIPNIPAADSSTAFGRFLQSIASLFKGTATNAVTNTTTHIMNKTFNYLCKVLKMESLAVNEGKASLSEDQLQDIENAYADVNAQLEAKTKALEDSENALKTAKETIASLTDQVAALKAAPAASSQQVIGNGQNGTQPEPNTAEAYIATMNRVRNLYNQLP